MSNKRKIIIALGALLVVATVGVLVIGALGYAMFSRRADNAELVFPATEVGTPVGAKVTKDIGPEGGTLASPDGRLTLTVPQNALAETIAFTIQPITNKSGGGLGLAYRLGPDGKTFTTPLQLSVRYDDHDLEGTVPEALAIAYQDAKGAWHGQTSAGLDQDAKTLTISTTHFTDEAFLAAVRVSPAEKTLYVGEDVLISLIQCKPQSRWEKLWSRPQDCTAAPGKRAWTLNGRGELRSWGGGILYEAPLKKPRPNIAYVDLTADLYIRNPATGETSSERKTFTTIITILDHAYKASGNAGGDTQISGDICDLEKSFTLKNSNPFLGSLKFEPNPTSPTEGTYSFSTENGVRGGGGGKYTITGSDTLWTGIELESNSTASVPFSGKQSGSGPVHLDLKPFSGDCKP